MQEDCQLMSLMLRNNSIGPEGATSLAFALMKNRLLEHLDLENCALQDLGVGIICEVLSRQNEDFDDAVQLVSSAPEK